MKRILIVEDDSKVRGNIGELLTSSGFDSLTATNGAEAMEISRNLIPDLVISDIMMPKMDGYEFYKKFSEKYDFYNIPFIFLSAKIGTDEIRKGMNLGADDYITKPFKAETLLNTIQARLDKSAKQRKLIDKFTSNIALYMPHELRTPLVSILGFSEIIKEDFDNLKKHEILSYMDSINAAGERLHERIEKFLVLVELELTAAKNNFENLINSSEIDIIEKTLFSISLQKNLLINIPNLPDHRINIAPHFLKVVVNELIENAIKFREKDTEIKVLYNVSKEKFELIIINNSKENVPDLKGHQIYDYFHFDKEKNQQPGNGMGLSIIKRIAGLYNLDFRISKNDNNEVTSSIIFTLCDK